MNQLQLAFSPICNFDFSIIKSDPILQNILKESRIYIIAQRPVLSFENIVPNIDEGEIQFEIRQIGNPSFLKCKLPIFQNDITLDKSEYIFLSLSSNDINNKVASIPINNIHRISLIQKDDYIFWISPEMFIHYYLNESLEAEVIGNIDEFVKYKVKYVGKATDQDIWKRLTGHATLQEILSIEYPLNYGSLPTHEIAILFLKFYDNISISSFGDDFENEQENREMVDTYLGRNMPSQKTIFLDAEKALIKAMQPKYNKEVYKSYPVSKDGLHKFKYNYYQFSIKSNIILQYEQGEIVGMNELYGGDSIQVEEGKSMKIVKYSKEPNS
ncbi:hypothetical protein [Adhaeribacter terreus]|uniref:Uncharacterized protein n=1 Tax=Adhaeribacter terreus TaxID=529703 RepID=A0ABW0EBV7_9BACT